MRQNKDLNYQLGMYVGEYIAALILPTLSTDTLKSRTVVEVSADDTILHDEISDTLHAVYEENWGNGTGALRNASSDEFEAYRNYNHELAEKYLDKKLKCTVPKVFPTDMKQFRDGLEVCLWNTDLSWYWPMDDYFEQTDEMAWCTYITLTLQIDN